MPITATRLRTIAVVLAGGAGSRIGLHIPKQLLKIAGKPIIEHTIAAFNHASEIDEIVVLMTRGFVHDVERIVSAGGYRKVTQVLEGGATRNDTTRRALEALGEEDCNVLFHDAVRPLVSQRIIRECVNELRRYEAVDVAIPSADTIIVADGDEIKDIPDRSRLRRGQTPQGFRLSTIRRAYELAAEDDNFAATDDCSVVLRYLPDIPIRVVEGDEQNMKVTHPVDVFLADKLFQLAWASVQRLETTDEYVEQLRGRTAVIFGGSYGIGAALVELIQSFGADAFSFSRSETGTHIERAEDVEAALHKAYEETGRIDYVVNTAAMLHTGPLTETDEATVEKMVQVNYVAPVTIARRSIRFLSETGGHLLLFTSSSYTRGRAGYSLYSSSKAAVVNLTQALADEWAPLGVRVSCINPERTATPMRARAFGEEPAGSLLTSLHVAMTSVDVLIADITGQVIDVRRVDPGRRDHAAGPGPGARGLISRPRGENHARATADAAREPPSRWDQD